MRAFRDYQSVIQTPAGCCGSRKCHITQSEPALVRQVFQAIVERTWTPAEIDRLRRAADSALS